MKGPPLRYLILRSKPTKKLLTLRRPFSIDSHVATCSGASLQSSISFRMRAPFEIGHHMQELPESVQQMVGTVFAMLTSGEGWDPSPFGICRTDAETRGEEIVIMVEGIPIFDIAAICGLDRLSNFILGRTEGAPAPAIASGTGGGGFPSRSELPGLLRASADALIRYVTRHFRGGRRLATLSLI